MNCLKNDITFPQAWYTTWLPIPTYPQLDPNIENWFEEFQGWHKLDIHVCPITNHLLTLKPRHLLNFPALVYSCKKKVEMCLEKVCQAALWGCLCCALLCTVGFFCNTLTLAVCCRNWLKSHVFVTNWPFLMKSIPNYPQIKIFTNTYRNNIYLIVMNLRNLKNFVSWVH